MRPVKDAKLFDKFDTIDKKSKKKLILLSILALIAIAAVTVSITGYVVISNPENISSYRTKEQLLSDLFLLEQEHPGLMAHQIIGKTVRGQDIYLFTIGNSSGGRVLVDGTMHGWEYAGSEAIYWTLEWLLDSNETDALRILRNNYILTIPIINLDNYGSGVINANGVNINRNFAVGFGLLNDSQRGPRPLSEPETQAIHNVFLKYVPDWYVNLHTGDYRMSPPWGHTNFVPEETVYLNAYEKISEISAERGVTPIPYKKSFNYAGGLARDEGYYMGAYSFGVELSTSLPDYGILKNTTVPQLIAIVIALSQLSETTTTTSTTTTSASTTTSTTASTSTSSTTATSTTTSTTITTSTTTTILPTDGLVAYWKFDEGSGSKVSDSSGNGNDGNISGATFTGGKTGFALQFDSVDDYVKVADSNSLDVSNAFTFEAWIYPKSFGENGMGRILDKTSSTAYIFYLRNGTNYPRQLVIYLDSNEYAAKNNTINLNKWQHVAVTFNRTLSSNQIKFYVNGTAVGTATRTTAVPNNTQPLYIGNRDDLARTFYGAIDEVRIYNRALSASEISAHYQGS